MVVILISVVTLLPFLTHAKPTDATNNNSKPYCNTTNYLPRTSIGEVTYAITDVLAKFSNLCSQNDVVSEKICS